MPRPGQQTAVNVAIAASLLIGRLGFLLFNPTGLWGDAFGYVNAAQTVLDTGKLPPLSVQPFGYLILLVLPLASGLDIGRVVLVLNALMDCSIIALLFWSSSRILAKPGDRGRRLSCWLLATIQPFTAEMVNSAYTETPTMFFVFVGVWLAVIPSGLIARFVGFGFLGVASLLRIDILIMNTFASVIYLFLFRHKTQDMRAALFGLLLLCVFPISMLAYQYYSTQEIGLVKAEF